MILLFLSAPADDSVGFIGATGAIYGPLEVFGISPGLIPSTAQVFAPGTVLVLALPRIGPTAVVFGPNLGYPIAITIGRIGPTARLFGPRFGQTYPLGAPEVLRIVARLFAAGAMGVEVAELGDSWDRRWLDELDDVGSGSVNLQNDDADLALVDYGSIVRFDLDGLACFAMVVETITRRAIDTGEEAEEFTLVAGRGLLAAWEDAIVYPSMVDPFRRRYVVSDVRTFSFASLEYDDSAWGHARATPAFYDSESGDNFGWPEGYPVWQPFWWWDRNTAGNAPAGDVYFRREFDIAVGADLELWVAVDDSAEVYLDGVQVLTIGGPYDGTPGHVSVSLEAGTHVIGLRGTNMNALKAGMIFHLIHVDPTTQVITEVTSSGPTTGVSVAAALALGYPATVPGFTPGRIIEILLSEAQTRGSLLGWTLTFDELTDSAGAPWPVIATVDFPIGMDLLSALRQLADTFIDVAVAPAKLELSAWVIGTRGSSTAVTFDPALNLTTLVHAGEG